MAYRKMRASRNGIGSSSRIYIARDHLLSVESTLFTERYFRFFFTDIQAIIVRRTDRGAIWSVLLAFVALLMTTFSIGAIPPGQWTPTPGYFTLALIALTLMIVNLIKGPTCSTFIQTSVTVQKIGALHRLKKTEGILSEIRSHIRSAQGSLTREQIELGTVMPEEEISTGAETWQAGPIKEQGLPDRSAVGYHRFAFAMVLVNACINALWLFIQGLAVYLAGATAGLAGFCGIIAALIVQTGQNTTARIRKLTWGVFASYLAVFFLSYSLAMYYTFRSGIERLSQRKEFEPFSFYSELVEMGPSDKPGLYVLTVITIVIYTILGISGLMAVHEEKHGRRNEGNAGNEG